MTVITWAEFPEIKKFKNEHNSALVADEMFLPSAYAEYLTRHRETAWNIVKIGILTAAILFSADIIVNAAEVDDLNSRVKGAYDKFIGIARWLIAGKGAWETLNKAFREDFDGAKRSFFQYLIVFGLIIGLPKGLDYVEKLLN